MKILEDKCGLCGKKVEEDEIAWFCFGEDGYHIGCPCRCLECWDKLEKANTKEKEIDA